MRYGFHLFPRFILTDPLKSQLDETVVYTPKTLPAYLKKYWKQRYFLFSKFSEGIWLNEQSWYSVTPESVAQNIAEHICNSCQPSVIVDAFCGAGGNSIQFAHYVDKVIAIDSNPVTLACARHNAEVYGVRDKIEFIEGDFFEYASGLKADAVFLSPPWGGPSYLEEEIFDLNAMEPYNLRTILQTSFRITPNVAVYVPRNSNIVQLREVASDIVPNEEISECLQTDNSTCLLTYLHAKGKCRAICAYYGDLAIPTSDDYEEIDLQKDS
ncbi:RNA cap guanine-N2 methyltransferase-domain-containing protein [Dipodascopsis uninucleata]